MSWVLTRETVEERLLNLGAGKEDADGDILNAGPAYSGEPTRSVLADMMAEWMIR